MPRKTATRTTAKPSPERDQPAPVPLSPEALAHLRALFTGQPPAAPTKADLSLAGTLGAEVPEDIVGPFTLSERVILTTRGIRRNPAAIAAMAAPPEPPTEQATADAPDWVEAFDAAQQAVRPDLIVHPQLALRAVPGGKDPTKQFFEVHVLMAVQGNQDLVQILAAADPKPMQAAMASLQQAVLVALGGDELMTALPVGATRARA
jgi:hypothetical protein